MNNNIHKDHDQSNKKPKLNKQNKNTFTVFHQNICSLLNKKEELLNSLKRNSPQIICISEHHLNEEELEGITLHSYTSTLGAKFCRQTHKCGGVCIIIQDNMHCTNINMDRYSNEKDIEIRAVKLHIISRTIIIITVYRSPIGNIAYFLNNLEAALNQVYNNTVDIILCADFNINYLNGNQNKQALNSLLTSYSLYRITDFPTRIHNNSHTMIDNIFINKFKNENYSVSSLINGLSGHNAQIFSLFNITVPDDRNEFYSYRKISKHS
jgi:exonuclease III